MAREYRRYRVMIRPIELTLMGISLKTVYRRAAALGYDKPYKFTQAQARRIINFKPRIEAALKDMRRAHSHENAMDL